VAYGDTTEWKLYGPDLNGVYGGLSGTGGFDGVSPLLNLFYPVISDYRGNILAVATNGGVSWNPARPTGYGAVPGFRPLALGHGANIAQSSAWRGRWTDLSGYYNLGLRIYDPVAGMWLSYDPEWNELDSCYLTFCGGDPVNGFDPQGKCENNSLPNLQLTVNPNANLGPYFTNPGDTTPLPQPYVDLSSQYTMSVTDPDYQAFLQNLAAIGQDVATGAQVASVIVPALLSDGTTALEEGAAGEEAAVSTETAVAGSAESAAGGSKVLTVNPSAANTQAGGVIPSLQGNVPNAAKWVQNGGTVSYDSTGGMKYTLQDGTSVQYSNLGYPDFSPHLYNGEGGLNTVRIDLTGDRYLDENAANDAAGFDSTPDGYTWHHNEDPGLMQLVGTPVHQQFWHTGGFSIGAQ
jgi:RHS repeat-associated protein